MQWCVIRWGSGNLCALFTGCLRGDKCMANPQKTWESVLMMYNLVLSDHLVGFNDGLHYVHAHSFQLCLWSTITSPAQRSPSTFRRHPALNLLVPLCWRRPVTFDSLSEREDKRRYSHSLCQWRVVEHSSAWAHSVSSLVPRRGGGRGERAPGAHCLHICLIAMVEFRGDLVHTCTYVYWWHHKLTALMCQLVFWVLYHTVLCLLVAGYLMNKQVASNECVYRGNMPLCG